MYQVKYGYLVVHFHKFSGLVKPVCTERISIVVPRAGTSSEDSLEGNMEELSASAWAIQIHEFSRLIDL